MTLSSVLTFSSILTDDCDYSYDEYELHVQYLGELIYFGWARGTADCELFSVLSFEDEQVINYSTTSYYFDEELQYRISKKLFGELKQSTIGLSLKKIRSQNLPRSYPLLQSQNYYYLCGHPSISVIPKAELNLLWEFIGEGDSPALEDDIQSITHENMVRYWILASGCINYQYLMIKSPDDGMLQAFQRQWLSESSSFENISITVEQILRGLLNKLLFVDLDTIYPRENGVEITVSLQFSVLEVVRWNAVSYVNDKWYLLVKQWMFELHGMDSLFGNNAEHLLEDFENSLYEK